MTTAKQKNEDIISFCEEVREVSAGYSETMAAARNKTQFRERRRRNRGKVYMVHAKAAPPKPGWTRVVAILINKNDAEFVNDILSRYERVIDLEVGRSFKDAIEFDVLESNRKVVVQELSDAGIKFF